MQSKIVMGSQFDADRAQKCIRQPPLDELSDESSRRHAIRALNTQFASWIQSQLQNQPDELWEDGVQDYLNRAKNIMEIFGDVVNPLRTNSAERGGIANIPSEDAQTEPLFGKRGFSSSRKCQCCYEPDGESQSIRVTKTMVTDPTLDDDRWGLFVMYKRKFWFEKENYEVPESYFYQTGEEIRPNTIELVKGFLKQVRESRGYDVDCCPPRMFESPFAPLPLEEMRQGTRDIDKFGYARVVEAAECAIQKISEETGHSYKLVKVEKAVLTRALVLFLTLTAEEDAGPVQTIQAAVYHPLGGNPVLEEWRFKPLPAH